MKYLLCSAVLLAAVGTAVAQQPVVHQNGCIVPQCGPVPQCCPAPQCDCAPATKTICVPQPGVKKTTHVCYCTICEDFCVPCLWRSCFSHCGGCGDCGTCEAPRPRYFLVKRVCVEECPTTICTPVVVPACGGCCPAPR
jgi:hypothetical protein